MAEQADITSRAPLRILDCPILSILEIYATTIRAIATVDLVFCLKYSRATITVGVVCQIYAGIDDVSLALVTD